MGKQVSLLEFVSNTNTKVAVLEKIVDYLVTNNQHKLDIPSHEKIGKFIQEVQADQKRQYPDGTQFTL